ncbi:MAG: class IV adenylate cyclase [Methanobacteriota archaeon]|nr:MAG: class IV adenylate cyclase [Euryarchaeota archaeon]
MIEIELKFRLENPMEFIKSILANGYHKTETIHQIDTYLNSPFHNFHKTDEALRIRETDNLKELTYKGPKTSKKSKMREEISVSINSSTEMLLIFNRLGFEKVAQVKKTRQVFEKDGTLEITVDEVEGLGFFSEFEITIEDEKDKEDREDYLRMICQQFGLNPDNQIRTSYLELLLSKERNP